MSAAQAAVEMKLPPGFRAQVFASEPMVQNPIAMAWDKRERLWIAENYTYAERAVRFDLKLHDRILILEDTNHDGTADQRHVYCDDLQMLSSLEMAPHGIYALCPPQLLFIPDTNGDDHPDGPAQVLLDGFTIGPASYHNLANGLRWGPDGWLYGRCGHSCPGQIGIPGTPAEKRIPIKGGLWRYHPQRQIVEVLCQGTTNPWGHDWDAQGECFFVNTVIGHLFHLLPGAHFKESWGNSPNPYVYERLDMIADHYHFETTTGWQASRDGKANDLGGGHAHAGMMIYPGGTWPAEYTGKLFTLNFHGRRANVERLERQPSPGAGYVARHEPDFLRCPDPWFRGVEMRPGPGDSAFVLDWSDTGECHEATGVHRTSGRVYKISYQTESKESKAPVAPLACLQGNGPLPELLRAHLQEKTTSAQLQTLLSHADEHVRTWAIRLLTEFWPLDTLNGPLPHFQYPAEPAAKAKFVEMAGQDPSGLVLLTLASTLQRLPLTERPALAAALVKRSSFAKDSQLPGLTWIGLTPLVEGKMATLVELCQASPWPSIWRWTARSAALRSQTEPAALEKLLAQALTANQKMQQNVLQGLDEGFLGWQQTKAPAAWPAFAALPSSQAQPEIRERLQTLFGTGRSLTELISLATNKDAAEPARLQALRALISAHAPELRKVSETLLETPAFTATALQGLATLDDPAIAQRILRVYPKFPPTDQQAALGVLTSRKTFAKALLDLLEAETKAETLTSTKTGTSRLKQAFQPHHARQILQLADPTLAQQLTAAWGQVRPVSESHQTEIATWKANLPPATLKAANLKQGHQLYLNLCSTCHKLHGEGQSVGPDLTGSGRTQLDYLLENILDPNGIVPLDYQLTNISLKDGRSLSGLKAAESPQTLTLRTVTESQVILKSDITQQSTQPLSLMPEGLLQALPQEMARNLLAYLMQPNPPAAPAPTP